MKTKFTTQALLTGVFCTLSSAAFATQVGGAAGSIGGTTGSAQGTMGTAGTVGTGNGAAGDIGSGAATSSAPETYRRDNTGNTVSNPPANTNTTGNTVNGRSSTGTTTTPSVTPGQVKTAQQTLVERGYSISSPNGRLSADTQASVRQFQQSQGLPVTGILDSSTLSALGISQEASGRAAPTTANPNAR